MWGVGIGVGPQDLGMYAGSISVKHNTFVGLKYGFKGNGLSPYYEIRNNIFSGCTTVGVYFASEPSLYSIDFNLHYDNTADYIGIPVEPQAGPNYVFGVNAPGDIIGDRDFDVAEDPLFTNAENNIYTVQPTSPAIGAADDGGIIGAWGVCKDTVADDGTDAFLYDADFESAVRIQQLINTEVTEDLGKKVIQLKPTQTVGYVITSPIDLGDDMRLKRILWHSIEDESQAIGQRTVISKDACITQDSPPTTQDSYGPVAHRRVEYRTGDEIVFPGGDISIYLGAQGVIGYVNANGTASRFYYPGGITNDDSGNLYIVDHFNHCVRKVTPDGDVSTFVGKSPPAGSGHTDGTTTNARFYLPHMITTDPDGNMYVYDGYSTASLKLRKVTPAGVVTTIPMTGTIATGGGTGIWGMAYYPPNLIYVSEYNTQSVYKIAIDTGVSTKWITGLGWGGVKGLDVDQDGNIYVVDTARHVIRKITPGGATSILAGILNTPGYQDGAGISAKFSTPSGLTVYEDAIYVADLGNTKVRKVLLDGTTSTAISGISTQVQDLVVLGQDNIVYMTEYGYHTVKSSDVFESLSGDWKCIPWNYEVPDTPLAKYIQLKLTLRSDGA